LLDCFERGRKAHSPPRDLSLRPRLVSVKRANHLRASRRLPSPGVTALVTEGLKKYGKNSAETMEALQQLIKVITPC
jgi:hypothetical protein